MDYTQRIYTVTYFHNYKLRIRKNIMTKDQKVKDYLFKSTIYAVNNLLNKVQ